MRVALDQTKDMDSKLKKTCAKLTHGLRPWIQGIVDQSRHSGRCVVQRSLERSVRFWVGAVRLPGFLVGGQRQEVTWATALCRQLRFPALGRPPLRGRRNGQGFGHTKGTVHLVRETGCGGGIVEPFEQVQHPSRRGKEEAGHGCFQGGTWALAVQGQDSVTSNTGFMTTSIISTASRKDSWLVQWLSVKVVVMFVLADHDGNVVMG